MGYHYLGTLGYERSSNYLLHWIWNISGRFELSTICVLSLQVSSWLKYLILLQIHNIHIFMIYLFFPKLYDNAMWFSVVPIFKKM